MPDGRVWTAGSNHNGAQSFPEPNVDNRELRIELYEPAYVGQSRPEILDVPDDDHVRTAVHPATRRKPTPSVGSR